MKKIWLVALALCASLMSQGAFAAEAFAFCTAGTSNSSEKGWTPIFKVTAPTDVTPAVFDMYNVGMGQYLQAERRLKQQFEAFKPAHLPYTHCFIYTSRENAEQAAQFQRGDQAQYGSISAINWTAAATNASGAVPPPKKWRYRSPVQCLKKVGTGSVNEIIYQNTCKDVVYVAWCYSKTVGDQQPCRPNGEDEGILKKGHLNYLPQIHHDALGGGPVAPGEIISIGGDGEKRKGWETVFVTCPYPYIFPVMYELNARARTGKSYCSAPPEDPPHPLRDR
ncbi:MAG: hypothetical protein LBE24_09185 [Methylobacillus sp.]|nr:hypothetical protein [Methylobacillus sp.]